jgi:hypothetical protein
MPPPAGLALSLLRAASRHDRVLDSGDRAGLQVGGRLGGWRGDSQAAGHWLEFGYGGLARLAGAEMGFEGLGVNRVQDTKDPARDVGVLKGVVHVIGH